MSTLTLPVTTSPDALPASCIPVRPGGVLARVRRTCATHHADAFCVAREMPGERLVFWCAEGAHLVTSPRHG
jgi:hypothetical protein